MPMLSPASLAAALGAGLLIYGVYVAVQPPIAGIAAILAIFLPHAMFGWLLFAPLAFRKDAWPIRIVLALTIITLGAGIVPESIGRPVLAAPPTGTVSAASWNLLRENRDEDVIIRTLLQLNSDLIGIQELSFEHARLIESSREVTQRYPYRLLRPDGGYLGLALLSRFPIADHGATEFPPILWASVDRGGDFVNVIVAHPLPARFSVIHLGPAFVPIRFDPTSRDAQIRTVRAEVDRLLETQIPLLVIGDFNVTSREHAYRSLARGLSDVHEAIAFGAGNSFMSTMLDELGLSVLRIDYLFAGPGVVPLTVQTDCTPRGSDHCVIAGTFGIQ